MPIEPHCRNSRSHLSGWHFQHQNRCQPQRCQQMIVVGCTISSASCQSNNRDRRAKPLCVAKCEVSIYRQIEARGFMAPGTARLRWAVTDAAPHAAKGHQFPVRASVAAQAQEAVREVPYSRKAVFLARDATDQCLLCGSGGYFRSWPPAARRRPFGLTKAA